jgi:lipoprotein-anchoring transpeptidase ErfK/SrfK
MLTIKTPDKAPVKASIKQKEQAITYARDKQVSDWPPLSVASPRPGTPLPKSPRVTFE